MPREVQWERMYPDELEAAFADLPAAYLTYGLCEPHGPHSAMGMDTLRPHAVACLAARRHGGIVAPPSWWHLHDYGIFAAWAEPIIGQARPWLTAMPPWMFFRNILYHVRAMDSLGFRATILFSGHLGPHAADLEPFAQAIQPHFATQVRFVTDNNFMPDEYRQHYNHAGKTETAYLWAVEPDCIDVSRIPAPDVPGPHFAMPPNAREADRRWGEAMVAAMADGLGRYARELVEACEPPPQGYRTPTFGEVEQVWNDVVRPMGPGMACMRELDTSRNQQPPPEGSRWHANWHIPEGCGW